ncbi:MAG: hypothetical protein CVV37_04705 [Nitrospira bacterium HGW-Nitrospira-1]|nr:MAG: hypothetical protein CVV37_04705 [Nitrospira bacterium HGW-Nitrospira-1]
MSNHIKNPLSVFRSRVGFTLIEVMVATVIMGIIIVVIMQLFSGGLRSSEFSRDYTNAVIYAKNKMEEVFVNPVSGSGDFSDDVTGIGNNKFRWEVEISPYEVLPSNETSIEPVKSENEPNAKNTASAENKPDTENKPYLTKIKVKVYWTDNNKQRSVELATLMANIEEGAFK